MDQNFAAALRHVHVHFIQPIKLYQPQKNAKDVQYLIKVLWQGRKKSPRSDYTSPPSPFPLNNVLDPQRICMTEENNDREKERERHVKVWFFFSTQNSLQRHEEFFFSKKKKKYNYEEGCNFWTKKK